MVCRILFAYRKLHGLRCNLIRALPRGEQPSKKTGPKAGFFAIAEENVRNQRSFSISDLSVLLFEGWVMLTGSEPAIDSSSPSSSFLSSALSGFSPGDLDFTSG